MVHPTLKLLQTAKQQKMFVMALSLRLVYSWSTKSVSTHL